MKLRADVLVVGAVLGAALLAWVALKEEPAASPAAPTIASPGETASSSGLSAPLPGSSSAPAGAIAPSSQIPPKSANVPSAPSSGARPLPPPPPPSPQIVAPAPAARVMPPAAAEGTAEEIEAALKDMDKVGLMLRDFRSRMKENPVGTNAEIMRAVMGENPKGARLGPPEGQQINGKGELVDRWGTPYFFHQMSRNDMEIKSAGPDRQMGTSDDIVQH